LIDLMIIRFRQAEPGQKVLYVAVIAAPLLLLIVLLTNLGRHGAVPSKPNGVGEQSAKTSQPDLVVVPVASAPAGSDVKTKDAIPAHTPIVPKTRIKKKVESKIAEGIPKAKSEDKPKSNHSENQAKTTNNNVIENNAAVVTSSGSSKTYILVTCVEGTEVFVDGISKGRIGSFPLRVVVSPGKHTVIVSLASRGIFTQSVELNSGKAVHIKPSLCN
jgi:hypothetical protein